MTDKQMQELCPFNREIKYCDLNDTGDYLKPLCYTADCKFLQYLIKTESRLRSLENDR